MSDGSEPDAAAVAWAQKHLAKKARNEARFQAIYAKIAPAFSSSPEEITGAGYMRSFYKWYFDLLKNMIAVAALFYLARKTKSSTLEYVAEISWGVLFGYGLTYVNSWAFHPFYWVKRWRLAFWLDMLAALLLMSALFGVTMFGLAGAVRIFADAQGR